ncbi:hypothetical protein FZ934_11585 [Rhizobium grahamii]|uniref:Uncharacterized protein n=1 Tax=Rhizobium grahamii TaxID=1120045 RepID=A0A5Q0C4Y7_9HYPH|nr:MULTISPECIES: hypothetical protein [Rhizobium]QFY60998.1 hypothetical protein FZ934_11585 [Rhizobium grahamii]QRM49852.1 hypothetical protein F3Y33_11305 [Rhizobium sp. BG6]
MADFIAVIRRAVDGLTDNTPEMRVKVYERARGAVQRQLENMKPRPPEAMLQRQLEKLEAAIREVEAEHAVALPADDVVAEEEVLVATAEGVAEEPAVVAEPEPQADEPETVVVAAAPVQEPEAPVEEAPAEEPVHHEPVYAQPVEAEESVVSSEPAYPAEPVYEEPTHHADDARYEKPEETARDVAIAQHDAAWQSQEQQPEPVSVPEEVEAFEPWQATHEEEAPLEAYEPAAETREAAPEHHAAFEEHIPEELPPAAEPYEAAEAPVEPASQPARDFDLSNRLVEPVYAFDKEPQAFVQHSREEPLHAEAAAHFDPVWAEHAEEVPEPPSRLEPTDWALEELRQFSDTSHTAPANDAARAFDDLVAGLGNAAATQPAPTGNEAFSWEAAAFDDLPPIENNQKPAATAHFDDGDLFSEVHGGQSQKPENPDDSWQEATQLRGYNNRGVVAEDDDGTAQNDIDSVIASKFQGRNLRMEPKRRRFGIGSIISVLIALGVVAGGAYAAWTHQDALTEMVKGLVSAAPSQTAKTETQTTSQSDTSTPTPQTADAGATKPAEAQKEVASLNDGSSVSNKFTQRLLADGTEVDNGAAAIPSAQAAEGKSVAPQNVASSDATPPTTATTPAATGTAPAAAAATAQEAQQAAPVGSSEKMFLYEERIGQSSPTAIQGSVAWTVNHEAGTDGKQEAVVQGTVTVPERNLTAQVNFKRNSDPSLPASHIVEVVFSLPANFEGGAIESVQRIAMKRTEQDRGDPLIAVPAKITDDFHMIALNDYPDARKANLDLLENRDWIDIPITYRNGRRALITMQKGTTGAQAFTSAIKEWAASGDVSTSQ